MMLANIEGSLSFDQVIAIIGLVASVLQAIVLPITIYLLVVQTRAMRLQTVALVEQSKEMTAQTHVFTNTIYSTTFQGIYDAEAHIGELMMTYPEASRILLSQVFKAGAEQANNDPSQKLESLEAPLHEQVRWLGTSMLDFFEHIWTQASNRGLPQEVWEAWEEYMSKMLSETRLRLLWQSERGYYAPGFRRFVDAKLGTAPDLPLAPPLPRLPAERPASSESRQPQVARIIRAVTEKDHA